MARTYPDGPKLNFAMVVIAQMLPSFFPFDPLAFDAGIAKKYGDIAHYKLGRANRLRMGVSGNSSYVTAASWS